MTELSPDRVISFWCSALDRLPYTRRRQREFSDASSTSCTESFPWNFLTTHLTCLVFQNSLLMLSFSFSGRATHHCQLASSSMRVWWLSCMPSTSATCINPCNASWNLDQGLCFAVLSQSWFTISRRYVSPSSYKVFSHELLMTLSWLLQPHFARRSAASFPDHLTWDGVMYIMFSMMPLISWISLAIRQLLLICSQVAPLCNFLRIQLTIVESPSTSSRW